MIETEVMINGPTYQTKRLSHKGCRRTVKFLHKTKEIVHDKVIFFKNHVDCKCLEKPELINIDFEPKAEKFWDFERIYELIGHDKVFHYRRPANHPDIKDAIQVGYTINLIIDKNEVTIP